MEEYRTKAQSSSLVNPPNLRFVLKMHSLGLFRDSGKEFASTWKLSLDIPKARLQPSC